MLTCPGVCLCACAGLGRLRVPLDDGQDPEDTYNDVSRS